MMKLDLNHKWLYFIAASLQIIWGVLPSASAIVITEIPVELFISLRWTISGTLIALYLLSLGDWRPVTFEYLFGTAVLGVLGYGVGSLGALYGLKIGGVVNFALMGSLSPVITATAAIFLLKEKPKKSYYFALPLCFMGLLLVIIGKHEISTITIASYSALLILGANFLDAFIIVFSKKFQLYLSSLQYLAIAQLSASIFMWTVQLTWLHQTKSIENLSQKGWISLLIVSIVACFLCYAILCWLLTKIDGHRLALFDSLHVLSGVIFGYLFLNEQIHLSMIVGGVFLIIGLLIATLKIKRT